jgi:hypothetical protein
VLPAACTALPGPFLFRSVDSTTEPCREPAEAESPNQTNRDLVVGGLTALVAGPSIELITVTVS